MQKVLTAEQMRRVDERTAKDYGIGSLLLMENAAHAAARVIAGRLGGKVDGASVLVICGKGNNGGDGAALARILWTMGANVEVCLLGLVSASKGDARTNFEILRRIADRETFSTEQSDLAFEEIASLEEWLEYDSLNFHSDQPDVIVDAMFGTGLSSPLEGVFAEAAAFIHANAEESDGPLVVSLDLPSGLNADLAETIGIAPSVDVTVTFTGPKPANVLPPASRLNGELVVANIGTPIELLDEAESRLHLIEARDAAAWLAATDFSPDSHKNQRGHALMIAGSAEYSGAAVLCGDAAMRSGVGLVTLAVPSSSRDSIASRVSPEVMVRAIADTAAGAVAAEAFDEIDKFISEKADAVAVGCGLKSEDESTRRFVRQIVENRRTPVIIDADGLNALAPFDLTGSDEFPLILTPHLGEFRRLTGGSHNDSDLVASVAEFSIRHHVYIVLKGERPLIAEPEGRVAVSPVGNSGLGKAGNGDTLTGIIAGFVAQAMKMNIGLCQTIVAAVYLAGTAGDIAERRFGKRVMTASDVRDCLHDAFRAVCEEV